MGKPTGFLEITRDDHGYAPVEERVKKSANKPPAVWIAVFLIVIAAVRCITSFPTGMIWCIAGIGGKHWKCCIPPIISRSLLAGFVPRPVKPPVP